MKNEFVLAFNEVLEEKQLPREVIVKALESAMVSAYRRAVNASNAQQIEAKIDLETGKVTIYAEKEVVEQVQDERTEVSLEEARRVNPQAELGSMVVVESTPSDFGRVAAQTARQVIQQRIRDAERQAQLSFYEKQLGEIVSGVVQAVNSQGLTIGLEMRAEGTMPRKEMIPGERFRIHDRVRALVAEVKDSPRGPQIILSRTHRDFLRRLLETEVPEIYHGIVEVRSIAREPGERAKVAVSATQPGIDPVGACVGIRGVRIQAIVRELHDEKIDVIEWNPDQAVYIAKALSPARVLNVFLSDQNGGGKTATVVVPEDQLSLAIGRDGQNARLAAKLTGWRIDIKSLPEAAADALNRLQTDPLYRSIAEAEAETAQAIADMLARKAENRPLTPEEYERMAQFVDRVERKASLKRVPEKKVVDTRVQEIQSAIAPEEFNRTLLESSLPEHVCYILQEAGYLTVGELVVQMLRDADQILKLQGIGPRAMQEINRLVEQVYHPTPAGEPAVVEPAEATEETPEEVAPTAEVVEEAPMAAAEPAEPVAAEVAPVEAAPVEPEVEEVEPSFDELFTLKPDVIPLVESGEEEEEEEGTGKKKKKEKKKKKGARRFVEIEYDPDADVTLARKVHKRGDEWEWD
ncbi:MAG TPA: transcription termination/antitermination protein NusA [Anaerolinea thermolimosa]|mgnify:CR=1 FL=1|uniref:Transcription termination/antitermination protein NusA n=1 Tax=Anaerolinea thermolimosa TaxID=229919 RepID=A0A3D1JGN8_9CHLR|nr:transcription termination factor NusA [Anaerolinea thermolimosa]GAP07964.1 NusA antitermination factor [Anaerolinea thermolimosa]HCE16766.1 transcription termination/antitermination protein NusA [Anaerolinea thermolimosa]